MPDFAQPQPPQQGQPAQQEPVQRSIGRGGLEQLALQSRDGYRAEVYLHGATVTSWRTPTGEELLFLSKKALFQADKAIRGGIPVIFPQFSGQGPLPAHGIARAAPWEVAETRTEADGRSTVVLRLTSSAATEAVWPEKFEAHYEVSAGSSLSTTLTITNRGSRPFSFQTALHTYFRVQSIDGTSVPGLRGLTYLDNLRQGAAETETAEPVAVDRELDRIYVNAPATLHIDDAAAGRRISINTSNFADAVLWNPWIEKAQRLSDMDDAEYREFVCLECGNIASRLSLEPGASVAMGQTIVCEKQS